MVIHHTSTASSSVIVAYDVTDLTMLRYYVPYIEQALCMYDDMLHVLAFDVRNLKYNGLGQSRNREVYDAIASELCVSPNVVSVDQARGITCDTLVTVESSSTAITCNRHVAIAHGLDCIHHANLLGDCDAYICGKHVAMLEHVRHLATVVPEVPMSLLTAPKLRTWALENIIDTTSTKRPSVTVFYPDRGHRSIADGVISQLASTCDVYIKQRRKWQDVTFNAATKVIYDDVWSPAEAVALPLATDITLGFGSTAYLDLIEAGVEYVDVDIWSSSIRPDMGNYTLLSGNSCVSTIVECILSRLSMQHCYTARSVDNSIACIYDCLLGVLS